MLRATDESVSVALGFIRGELQCVGKRSTYDVAVGEGGSGPRGIDCGRVGGHRWPLRRSCASPSASHGRWPGSGQRLARPIP